MIIIPISIINKLRNELVNELNRTRSKINNRNGKQEVYFKDIKIEKDDFSYVYKVSNLDQLKVVKEYASSEDIYFKSDDNIYPYPRISNGLIKVNNKQILINELSDLDSDKIVIANAYLNTTNIYALYTLYSLGVKRVTLSLELGFERIKNMIERYKDVFNEIPNVEVIVYGKIDLMVTKHCLINKATSCLNKNNCNDDYALIDRKGYRLKLVKDGLCNIRILNPKKLHLIDYLDKLKLIGVSKLRLEFNDESSEEVKKVIEGYKNNYLELSGVSNGYFSEEERQ